ncbi:MAG: hypothetical protein EBU26_01610 [Verrucomicrobia bacterium]|nr:hypothetical protein [Verrucomicrobiota bacterium]
MIRWLTCCCLVIQTILLCAEDWRQFRGPQASGIAQQPHPPTTLGQHHIRWQTHLPGRGLSSPIIVGNHVYLSAAQGDDQSTLVVMAFHESSGEMAWKKTFHATGRTMCHEKTCVAAPTPVSDGSSLCVLFSSNDLVSLNLDGTLRWYRGITPCGWMGSLSYRLRMTASPWSLALIPIVEPIVGCYLIAPKEPTGPLQYPFFTLIHPVWLSSHPKASTWWRQGPVSWWVPTWMVQPPFHPVFSWVPPYLRLLTV